MEPAQNRYLLNTSRRIHCLGIGGAGMSALAGVLKEKGKIITGHDAEESAGTRQLSALGIPLEIGKNKSALPAKTDLIVASLAVSSNDPALKEAHKRRIPMLTYPQAVGELTRQFFTIAVCGTHGKTTTTALIAKILIENHYDPSVIVGSSLKELGGRNFRTGKSKILVLEACEYRRAFLNYAPRAIVLLSLDPDHLDYYKDFEDYLSAFREFAAVLPKDGYFFGNSDDADVADVTSGLQKTRFPEYNVFTVGSRPKQNAYALNGTSILHRGVKMGDFALKIPGAHNRMNALSAFAVAKTIGITSPDILKSLNSYEGAGRRFETKGMLKKTVIVDDYGHHPDEIRATLQAAHERFGKGKICVVFQPHQYSRTKKFLKEFAKALAQADGIVIPNIYASRDTEEDKASVSEDDLVRAIKAQGGEAVWCKGLENTAKWLKKNAKEFNAIIMMGAGDVWKIADMLLKKF